MTGAYYNEHDPYAAAWLRNLIEDGHIAPGDVDERDINEVSPDDVRDYTQRHWFAGIGGWSLALRMAGVPDDVAVETGSCPCFVADTLVLTARGLIPIQDVQRGDSVWTHRKRWKVVTQVGSEVAEKVIAVKGYGHYGLQCTPDHPFYVGDDDWCPADQLMGRRWGAIAELECAGGSPPPLPTKGVNRLANGKWRASGWKAGKAVYLGQFPERADAVSARRSALREGQIDVRGADGVDISSVEFARFLGYWIGDGWTVQSTGMVVICGAAEQEELLNGLVQALGMKQRACQDRTGVRLRIGSRDLVSWLRSEFGAGATGKHLPLWLYAMPAEYRQSFLRGYYEADGTAIPNGSSYVTVSRRLAFGVKVLAHTLGRGAGVEFHRTPDTKVIEGRIVRQKNWYRVRIWNDSKKFRIEDGVGWERVRSTSGGNDGQRVFNLAVADDNSYTADGIFVHNCQPFSVAGKGAATDDPRHLWPTWFGILRVLRPERIFGEQVPGAVRFGWLDGVCADLEGEGYTVGSTVLGAHSVGAPHLRQRIYWVAHTERGRLALPIRPLARSLADSSEPRRQQSEQRERAEGDRAARRSSGGTRRDGRASRVVDADGRRHQHAISGGSGEEDREREAAGAAPPPATGGVGDSGSGGREQLAPESRGGDPGGVEDRRSEQLGNAGGARWLADAEGEPPGRGDDLRAGEPDSREGGGIGAVAVAPPDGGMVDADSTERRAGGGHEPGGAAGSDALPGGRHEGAGRSGDSGEARGSRDSLGRGGGGTLPGGMVLPDGEGSPAGREAASGARQGSASEPAGGSGRRLGDADGARPQGRSERPEQRAGERSPRSSGAPERLGDAEGSRRVEECPLARGSAERGGEEGCEQRSRSGRGPGGMDHAAGARAGLATEAEPGGDGGSTDYLSRQANGSRPVGDASLGGEGALDGESRPGGGSQEPPGGSVLRRGVGDASGEHGRSGAGGSDGPQAGYSGGWDDFWLVPCGDAKARRVESGSFPLASRLPLGVARVSTAQHRLAKVAGLDGASLQRAKSHRVGTLRGYGNAIVPQTAALFVRAFLELAEEGNL